MMAPFWGNPTSTLDWCEGNYEVTWYVAEFWNTITNLSMIIPSIYGIYKAGVHGNDVRLIICNLLFLSVGIGSLAFHMTLKYYSQLLDEMPMVWGTSYMIYCFHMTLKTPRESSGKWMAMFLIFYCLCFTVVYLTVKNPIFFQFMYGVLVCFLFGQCIYTLKKQYSRQAALLYVLGLVCYVAGFILWNIDIHLCSNIQSFRDSLPEVLRPLTQLHGWWHLLAGYATYLNIQYWEHHRLTFMRRPVTISPSWLGIEVKKRCMG